MNEVRTVTRSDQGTREFWQQLADHMPQLAWVADSSGSIGWYNRPWYEYTGTTLEQMQGWGWKKVHHPNHVERVVARFEQAIASGEPWEDLFPLRSAAGDYRWFLSRANPLRDDQGLITNWFGTNTDVTEQLETQQALQDTSERVQLALEAGAIIGTWVWDLPADRFTVDEQFAYNFGLDPAYGRAGLPLEQVIEPVHPDDKPGLLAAIDEVVGRGGPYAHQYRVRRRDGAYYWIEANGRVDFAPDGTPLRFPGVLIDIHDRKMAELSLRRSEQRYRTLFDSIDEGFCIIVLLFDAAGTAVDYRFLETNPAFEHQSGLSRATGKTIRELAPDTNDLWVDRYASVARTGKPVRFSSHAGALGRWFDVYAFRFDDDQPSQVAVLFKDNSQDRQRQEALEKSEAEARLAAAELQAIYDAAPVGLTVLDRDLRYLRINELLAEINGLSAAEHIGKTVREVVPDIADQAEAALRRVLEGEELWGFELSGETPRAPGVKRTWRENWIPMRNDAGEIVGIAISAEEITHSKEAEARLREAEQRYRTIFRQAAVGVARVSPEGPFLEVNDRYCEILGRTREELLGGGWKEITHPDDLEADASQVAQIARGEIDSFTTEKRYLAKDGSPIWVNLTVAAERDENGQVLFYIPVVQDIGARKEAEEALRESEARLRAVINAMPVGLVFADASGQITGGNNRVQEILGGDVIPSSEIGDYADDYVAFHPDGRQVESAEYPLARVLNGEGGSPELECLVRRFDGRLAWVRYVAAPMHDEEGRLVGGVVASLDVDREKRLTESLEREVERVMAEREAAQEALRQSQKLEAMGQLTGGVAHDFNNLLTPIIGGLDLIHRKQIGDARTQRLIEGALQSAEKARLLVQRLLAFARRQPLQPTAVDVGRVVTDMGDLIASTSGPRVKLDVAVEPDLPPAMADANQLEMALLNLSVNARDAMPDGGILTIAARREEVREGNPLGLAPAGYVALSVTDTGTGMNEETQRRAIEPFFSTKGIGKGTGLGLSMVHGLAAQLGGALKIRSRPGLGTSIELWLPAADCSVEEREKGAAAVPASGAGIALLVDDEELVRVSTASMLAELGYEVVEASSAEDALRRIKAGLQPAVLVTDHLMPGMTGTDLALRLRAKMPNLPVLIVSGYADLDSLAGSLPHLTKPFRQEELAHSLKALSPTPK